ncbi:uncharacterized protein LOC128227859 [Mya arenaria]|uniref:uncharacterized protein LOC128227859 n=1 Tax=Mya arenaria TaxID=6604 RepID=UPI0022E335C7|nr:uncharacterized protein LOC128227859 [Mya arenaria]XP_052794720.1 uncharacterized protein LOC128227859 [Mya arenaria]XP_052794721.1 uncharacterized protein LOC128227859 [Mya arenaria]
MEVPGKKLQAGPSTANTTYCQPCEQDDEILPAEAFCTVCKEFFCSKCASLHRKQKISRSHNLLDKSNMPTSISGHEDNHGYTEPCKTHPEESIKYFCSTHQTLICGHCAVQNHRSCHADVISDISKAFKDDQEYGDVIKTIARLFEDIDLCASDVKKNVDVVAKLGENEVYKLRRYRQEVNKYFEEREQALLKLIEKTKHMDEELLESLKPKYTNLKSKLEEINVKLAAQENNMIQLFIETKKAKKLLEGLQNDIADIKKDNVIHHYEFRKDPATDRLIASDTGLGTLKHIATKPHKIASASESDHSIKGLTVQGDGTRETMEISKPTVDQVTVDLTKLRFTSDVGIPMKSPTDYLGCRLSSMLKLTGSRMLIADSHNNNVKVVDMQTNSLVSQINVPGDPWGICHLPGDRVAVTMTDKGVQFLATGGQLAIGDHFKVDGDCRGIDYHEERLIVSFYNGKVAVLNMNGHVIRQIERDGNGNKLFQCPLYLTLVCEDSTDFIYISDDRSNTITKLDMNLNITKTFQDPALKGPRSITALGNQLLITGCRSNNIMILDLSTGQMTQLIGKEGIRDPMFAYCFSQQGKLLVTEVFNNSLKVFNTIA